MAKLVIDLSNGRQAEIVFATNDQADEAEREQWHNVTVEHVEVVPDVF